MNNNYIEKVYDILGKDSNVIYRMLTEKLGISYYTKSYNKFFKQTMPSNKQYNIHFSQIKLIVSRSSLC